MILFAHVQKHHLTFMFLAQSNEEKRNLFSLEGLRNNFDVNEFAVCAIAVTVADADAAAQNKELININIPFDFL